MKTVIPDVVEHPGTWLTRLELEELAAELRRRGHRVSADVLLDVGAEGCFAHHAAQRACAVAPELGRVEAERFEPRLQRCGHEDG